MPEWVISVEPILVAKAGHRDRSDWGVWERSDSSMFTFWRRRLDILRVNGGTSFQRRLSACSDPAERATKA